MFSATSWVRKCGCGSADCTSPLSSCLSVCLYHSPLLSVFTTTTPSFLPPPPQHHRRPSDYSILRHNSHVQSLSKGSTSPHFLNRPYTLKGNSECLYNLFYYNLPQSIILMAFSRFREVFNTTVYKWTDVTQLLPCNFTFQSVSQLAGWWSLPCVLSRHTVIIFFFRVSLSLLISLVEMSVSA